MFDESNLFYKMVDWEKRLEREKSFFKQKLESVNPSEGEILDLGCGIGHHLTMFAHWGHKGLGLDFSEASIEIAINKAKEDKIEHLIEYAYADMRELLKSVENRKFDLIICIGNSFALFPLEERIDIIDQAIQVLKPSGKIILQVVNYLKHGTESEWTINPNVFRNEEGMLSFFVRILEWSNNRKEKVNMYVQKLHQDTNNPKEFVQSQKDTEFFVVRKSDFISLENERELDICYLGDFSSKEFEEEKSNDLIVIIEKR
jgi:SAM-dependent methyltransferase